MMILYNIFWIAIDAPQVAHFLHFYIFNEYGYAHYRPILMWKWTIYEFPISAKVIDRNQKVIG